MALPLYLPSDRLTADADDLVSDGIATAAIEVSALSLEHELRYCFDRLGVPVSDVNAIFDQAAFDARLLAPNASAFECRHRTALMVRASLKALIKERAR